MAVSIAALVLGVLAGCDGDSQTMLTSEEAKESKTAASREAVSAGDYFVSGNPYTKKSDRTQSEIEEQAASAMETGNGLG